MDDQRLIGYCESHCTTERALFNGEQISRMIRLAGQPKNYAQASRFDKEDWLSVDEATMLPLVKLARENLAWREKYKIVKFNMKASFQTATGAATKLECNSPIEAFKSLAFQLVYAGAGVEAMEAVKEAQTQFDEWKANQNV